MIGPWFIPLNQRKSNNYDYYGHLIIIPVRGLIYYSFMIIRFYENSFLTIILLVFTRR